MTVPSVTNTAVAGTASAHTLQAFIELVYIKTANDVLVEHMASLEQQLSLTQGAMDTLTRIQNLHNLATVKSKGTFGGPSIYQSDISVSDYRQRASAFFGTPVLISASFATISGGINGFLNQMRAIRSQLVKQIAALASVTPVMSGTGSVDSNSLLAKLRLVLKDIDDTGATNDQAGALKWLIDNYNSSGTGATSSGAIQQRITNAITAGQSLNTTQTESVRNFLYLFEEYYKSASAVLQAINQIITKMADGIAR